MKKIRVCIMIDPELKDRLTELDKDQESGFSYHARKAIELYLGMKEKS